MKIEDSFDLFVNDPMASSTVEICHVSAHITMHTVIATGAAAHKRLKTPSCPIEFACFNTSLLVCARKNPYIINNYPSLIMQLKIHIKFHIVATKFKHRFEDLFSLKSVQMRKLIKYLKLNV